MGKVGRLTDEQKQIHELARHIIKELDLNRWNEKYIYAPDGSGNFLEFEEIARRTPKNAADLRFVVSNILRNHVSYVHTVKDRGAGTWYINNGRYYEQTPDSTIDLILEVFSYQYRRIMALVDEAYDISVQSTISANAPDKGADPDGYFKYVRELNKAYNEEKSLLFKEHSSLASTMGSNAGWSLKFAREIAPSLLVPEDVIEQDDKNYLVFDDYVLNTNKLVRMPSPLNFEECIEPHRSTIKVTRALDWSLGDRGISDNDTDFSLAPTFMKFLYSSICYDMDTYNPNNPDQATIDMAESLLRGLAVSIFAAPNVSRAWYGIVGVPASGKSVLTSVVNKMFEPYTVFASNRAVSAGVSPQSASFEMNVARDARIIFMDEIENKLDDATIKRFSGSSIQRTEGKGKDSEQWEVQGILFLISNFDFKFKVSDDAMLERFKPIFMNKNHTAREKDPLLPSKLWKERDGILRVLVRALIRARDAVREITGSEVDFDSRLWDVPDTFWQSEYKTSLEEEHDAVGAFWDGLLRYNAITPCQSKSKFVKVSEFQKAFVEYQKTNGVRASDVGGNECRDRIAKMGLLTKVSNQNRIKNHQLNPNASHLMLQFARGMLDNPRDEYGNPVEREKVSGVQALINAEPIEEKEEVSVSN